jgi:hypothetical protein
MAAISKGEGGQHVLEVKQLVDLEGASAGLMPEGLGEPAHELYHLFAFERPGSGGLGREPAGDERFLGDQAQGGEVEVEAGTAGPRLVILTRPLCLPLLRSLRLSPSALQ